MTIKEELAIVEKAKTDIHAFRDLYEYYFPKLFAYTANRISDRDTCEDIVANVFTDAIEAIGKFDPSKGHRFGAWLYRVTHNKIVDFYKEHKALPIEIDNPNHVQSTSTTDSEQQAHQAEKQSQIQFVLTKIKPRYQQVLTLKYYTELENPEIAEVMDIKTSQVAVLVHRAHKAFKKIFKKNYPKSEIF